jgi:hypothetical protein
VTGFVVNPRRAPRAPIRCSVRAEAQGTTWQAETEDVGPHGCQLVAPAPLARGLGLHLTISAPAVGAPLQLAAQVAWVSSHSPWRVGVAFEPPARPVATRWFEQLLAAHPGLASLRRVPDRLPVDAMVFLGAPPRFADFTAEELELLRHVGNGASIKVLRHKLHDSWTVSERMLFALLSRGLLTVAGGAASKAGAWKQIMREAGVEFVLEARTSPTPPQLVYTKPAAQPEPPAGPVEAGALPASMPPPPMSDTEATAGTGWRGAPRRRSADAQEAFDLGRAELAEGRFKTAMALLRRALQLSPGDAEVAAELGKAMRG